VIKHLIQALVNALMQAEAKKKRSKTAMSLLTYLVTRTDLQLRTWVVAATSISHARPFPRSP